MALSRPTALANIRRFSTSVARMAGDSAHEHGGYKIWRTMTYVVCFPAIIMATVVNLGPGAEHTHRPEFHPYEYMRIRSKKFPWGDGNHSLFHNDRKNALPDGYEAEDGHDSIPTLMAKVVFKQGSSE